MRISALFSLLLIAALSTAAPEAAALEELAPSSGWGTIVQVESHSNCPRSSCFSDGTQSVIRSAGGEFAAMATVSDNTFASAFGSATFSAGSNWLPELRVYAQSSLRRGADSVAIASQRFVYSGEGEDVSLEIQLHGVVIDNPTGFVENTLAAQVAVLEGDGMEWNPNFLFGSGTELNSSLIAESQVFGLTSRTGSTTGTTLSFRLNPGEVYYVFSYLTAGSKNGTVDGSGTLSMALISSLTGQSVANLTATAAPVPEPSTLNLMMLGALVFGIGLHCRSRYRVDHQANSQR